MQARVIFVHGFRSRPDNHWFPWLRLELLARNFDVNAPQMPACAERSACPRAARGQAAGRPRAAKPALCEWPSFLKEYVGRPGKSTFFVGHGLGCVTIARYLASLAPQKAVVGGCVFVAGFSGRVDIPDVRAFNETSFQPKEARRRCEKFTMIFSDNDPMVPLERSLSFARELGAKAILERGKGHFCVEDGVTALPSALLALLKMSS